MNCVSRTEYKKPLSGSRAAPNILILPWASYGCSECFARDFRDVVFLCVIMLAVDNKIMHSESVITLRTLNECPESKFVAYCFHCRLYFNCRFYFPCRLSNYYSLLSSQTANLMGPRGPNELGWILVSPLPRYESITLFIWLSFVHKWVSNGLVIVHDREVPTV